ncbi:MAG TPA: competence/damage-inducible protein A [Dehalococcoidia bacterium]|nr:competence/damage-inducible protein A [Dehalococcoidia bacterium]
MKAEIVSVGTEILLGEILDTNAQYIAARLPALGIDCNRMSQIGDNLQRLTEAFRSAWEQSDLVIITGGLGPTEDDLTREALAAALDEPLSIDPGLEEQIRSLFANRGWPMPERNIKQAMLIPSARPIPNPRGTAPGWWVEREGHLAVAMPGVPPEMYHMWENEVAPELRRRETGAVIISRTVKTAGIGEGTVDEMVSHLLKSSNPSIGVYAKIDGIHLRITAKAATEDECRDMIRPLEDEVLRILGPSVWGFDDDTLETSIGRTLTERCLTLATMESCTGGLLASTLTEGDGASSYFLGGVVAYATEQKIAHGVDASLVEQHGVISSQVAVDMARAVRERVGSDIGLGITGVAGPALQEDKPVGTIHIGLDYRGAQESVSYTFPQGRQQVRARAVTTALFLLRRVLSAEAAG